MEQHSYIQPWPYEPGKALILARFTYAAQDATTVKDAKTLGTKGFVVNSNEGLEGLVIAFRGINRLRDRIGKGMAAVSWAECSVRAYKGFLDAYSIVRNDMLQLVYSSTQAQVYVTGYSWGAALATLAALDIKINASSKTVAMYNFGSPGVGNDAFAQLFDSLVTDGHRVVTPFDFVTRLPLLDKTTHVGQEHLLGHAPPINLLKRHSFKDSYIPALCKENQALFLAMPGT